MEKLGYGVRVPAIIVSPYVKRQGVSSQVFDHTSVLKTILMKYCDLAEGDSNGDWLSKRVLHSNGVSELLTEEVGAAIIAERRNIKTRHLREIGRRLQAYQEHLERLRDSGIETPGYMVEHEPSHLQQLLQHMDRLR
jgi:hypothetical protein